MEIKTVNIDKGRLDVIYNEDCIGEKGMKILPDKSIDMILCDLPYGTTACKWDKIIPFEPLWKQLKRVIKPKGAIVLTASQPFTTILIASNMKMFKYCWVWNKKQGGNPLNAKWQPLRITEDVVVFNAKIYYPQMRKGRMRKKGGVNKQPETTGRVKLDCSVYSDSYYPVSIIEIANCSNRKDGIHPTQKPVPLMEYLIKTYTNEGEVVLDFAIGSGTTAVACVHLKRHYIGFDTSKKYCRIAKVRLEAEKTLWDIKSE